MNSSLVDPETSAKIETNIKGASARASRLTCYVVLSLLIILFGMIRYRLRNMPLERDEGEYAYAGQLLLQGIPPYQIAYNMKLPGTYVAYAAIMAVFGETAAGIHLGVLLVNAITTLLMFVLARRFFGHWISVVAAGVYALLSTMPAVLGLEGHATHFVVLFAIAGVIVLLSAIDKDETWLIFCAGLLLGLAFLMKQPGIFFPVFGLIYLGYCKFEPTGNQRNLLAQTGAYIAGAILPFALTCWTIYRLGLFQKFWFWTFSYARAYVTSNNLQLGLENFRHNAIQVIRPSAFLWAIAGFGLISVAWNNGRRRVFHYAFFVCSFLAVCPGLYFRPHYFIVLLPAASLLVAEFVQFAHEYLSKSTAGIATAVPALAVVLAFAGAIFTERAFLFTLDPVSACRAIYPKEPFPELERVAEYVQSQTTKDEPFEVLGADPQTYFYARRRSVSGFMYIYPLTEDQPYALPMQREVISDIEAARPEFIVWVYDWDIPAGPRQLIIRWMAQYLHGNYEAVSVIMQPDSSGAVSLPSRGKTPMIAVFRRRA
ncbi:MAG TPA: glycosyltransferase family 39 protein [Terriglobales bacterium]|nr:glycosyltransferase family 39 protein [Terriglobales bacterium]